MKLHGNVTILSLYMDGRLDVKTRSLLESHLKDCRDCREILAGMRETSELISGTAPVRHPDGFEDKIIAGLPKKTAPAILSVRRIYIPALGTLAVLLAVSLFIMERTNTDRAFKIAKKTVSEESGTDNSFNELETHKNIQVPSVSEKSGEVTPGSETTGQPVPEDKKILSEKQEADRVTISGGVLPQKEKKAEEQICPEPAKTSAAVMKPSADEAPGMALRGNKTPLTAIIIRNADEWKEVWHTQNTVQNLSLPLPEVDFKEKMVVALPSKTEDKEYVVVKTLEEKDRIVVEYRERPLQKSQPPPYQLNVVNRKPVVELQNIDSK